MPVHRLMLTPSALSIAAWESVRPVMVTMTPYSTNRPPMMRRRSKMRAAVADLPSSSVTSRWTSCSVAPCSGRGDSSVMVSSSSRDQNENGM